MSAMAGQKAGPNRLNFVEGTQGYPGGNIGKKMDIEKKNFTGNA